MGAYFGTLFDDAYTDFLTSVGGFLLQAAGSGKACRAGADDDNVKFHVFATHVAFPSAFVVLRLD